MPIRRATKEDIPAVEALLAQILEHHHKLRPDILKLRAASSPLKN